MYTIEERSLDSIRPYPGNPRINDSAVNAVAASIREFGFRQPIVVDEHGEIIVGHTRYKVAQKLDLQTVPVHVMRGLPPEKLRAYRIADNQTAMLSTWDEALLVQELLALQEAEVDLDLTGFSGEQLSNLLEPASVDGLTDPDDIPEPPDEAITQPGDLYQLGDHRLLCGDAGNREDVDRLVDGNAVHLINTDPPYGVRVEPRSNNAIAAGLSSFGTTHHHQLDVERHPRKAKRTTRKLRAKDRPLVNDFVDEEEFQRLLRCWFGNLARVLLPGRSFYVWGGYANLASYPPVLREHGLYFSQGIVWDKEHPVLTRKDFMGCFELVFYGWKERAAHEFLGPDNARDLWHIKKINPQSMIHLTEKPVELATQALDYSSRRGENVLDLFGGSGSTLIAAEQRKRRAFLMEIDPLYCDAIVRRWEAFTGKQAERTSRN
jgi:DNA modification methylase